MPIWKFPATLEDLKERSRNTLMDHLGIEYLEIGDDYVKARMPVDDRTKQTAGILHGGASAALAETLGSIAAGLCVDQEQQRIVGLEISAKHIRQVNAGWVTGITRPIHVGKTTQIWEIRINDERDKLVCISWLSVANIDKERLSRDDATTQRNSNT